MNKNTKKRYNKFKFHIRNVDTIRPICIPTTDPLRSKDFLGYQPFVAGWGKTQENGNSANVLQELQITVLTNQECKEKYKLIGKLVSEQQFDSAVLCAGELIGGKDSCQGDSGGPLMAPQTLRGKTYYYQIGIGMFFRLLMLTELKI